MKKLLTMVFVVAIVLGICTFAASAEQLVDVTINGVEVDFDVPAQVINDRTLVPLRGIFEVLGAEVNWEDATQTVTASKGDTAISLQIGSTSLYVNGEEKIIDVPAQLVNDRTLIPARAVAESLGATVEWDDANQTVIITDASTPDFAAILNAAMSEELEYKSSESKFNAEIAITSGDEALAFNMTGDVKVVDDESYGSEINFVMDIMGEKTTATVYMVEENGKLCTYAVAEYAGEQVISKQEMEVLAESGSMDLTPYKDYVKVVAQEKVEDKDTVKFVTTITGEQLNAILAASDVEGVLAESGLTELFAADSELDMYFWVDKANNMAYKVNLDITDTLAGVIESIGVEEGLSVDACVIDVEITGINTVEEIVVPDEVKKNAVDAASIE